MERNLLKSCCTAEGNEERPLKTSCLKPCQNPFLVQQIGEIREHATSDYVRACREFQKEIEEEGFFETSYAWYLMKTAVSYAMLAVTIYLFLKGRDMQNEWIQVLLAVVTIRMETSRVFDDGGRVPAFLRQ